LRVLNNVTYYKDTLTSKTYDYYNSCKDMTKERLDMGKAKIYENLETGKAKIYENHYVKSGLD